MAQTKPILKPADIWASNANAANKQKPNQSKLDSGWVYGEKPPHNEFNWWWSLVGELIVHLEQHGVPAWDSQSSYQRGAFAFYGTEIYQWTGTNGTSGQQPTVNPKWIEIPNTKDVTDLINTIKADLSKIYIDINSGLNPIQNQNIVIEKSWNGSVLVLDTKRISTITQS